MRWVGVDDENVAAADGEGRGFAQGPQHLPLVVEREGKPMMISSGEAAYGCRPRRRGLAGGVHRFWSVAPRPVYNRGRGLRGDRTGEGAFWAVKTDGQGDITGDGRVVEAGEWGSAECTVTI